MIAYLKGVLFESDFNIVIIDVQGVGYEVNIPMSTYDKLPLEGNEVALYIHTIVREDAFMLFGFFTKEERDLFKILINVSGVGGKLANGILSSITIESFVSAIRSNNVAILNKISGVGKKTAERLIVELKDKLDNFDSGVSVMLSDGKKVNAKNSQVLEDTVVALSQLGFKKEQSLMVLDNILRSEAVDKDNVTVEELLKLALRSI